MLLTGIALVTPAVAADEIAHCWYESSGRVDVLKCRLADNEIVVYSERTAVPQTLYPAIGLAGNGACWYYRTVFTGWIAVATVDGETQFYYDPDGIPGGPIVADATYPRCEDEPVDVTAIEERVWDVVRSFPFEEPVAALEPFIGVTGLPTFVDLDPPDTVTEVVTSPGASIDVEFTVSLVTIDWGDRTGTDLTPTIFDLLGGYPDGEITHTYETKDYYDPEIAYHWQVRWRVNDGTWRDVTGIDPTIWTTSYRVDEIVTRITG
jgi:hypothetical protein